MKRFREAVGIVTTFFTTGLDVVKSIKIINPSKDLSEAYDWAEEFIAIKEAMGSLKPHSHSSDKPRDRDRCNNPKLDMQPKRSFNNGFEVREVADHPSRTGM